jgi:hypothetical protein
MDRATVMRAKDAMADPKANAVEVARSLGITTTTLYAYVKWCWYVEASGTENFDLGISGLAASGCQYQTFEAVPYKRAEFRSTLPLIPPP